LQDRPIPVFKPELRKEARFRAAVRRSLAAPFIAVSNYQRASAAATGAAPWEAVHLI
jgi:hypothetical protein